MDKLIITDEQINKIKPFMPNIKKVIKQGYYKFMVELNDIIVLQLDGDYNSTPNSDMLQKLYNEINDQN